MSVGSFWHFNEDDYDDMNGHSSSIKTDGIKLD